MTTSVAPQDADTISDHPLGEPRPLRAIVIGAGASGLNFAYAVQRHLRNVEIVLYEKNNAVGGTWLENRYPGVCCDIPSHNYQFSWHLNPDWSSFYVTGPEILRYFQDAAKAHDLEKYVKLNKKITKAQWDESTGMWYVDVEDQISGEMTSDAGHFLINGTGFLNNWKWPDIPGLHDFKGPTVHTANWPEEVDLKNKTVAIIGNGSTGIQLLAEVYKETKKTVTFIRSPTWITPGFVAKHAGPGGSNFEYSAERKLEFKNDPEKFLQYRKDLEDEICQSFHLIAKDSEAQAQARQYLAEAMRTRLGPDNPLADFIVPDFSLLCRRATPGLGYLEALTQPNVQVVTESIQEVVKDGIKLKSGEVILVDVIICATGFDLSWKPRFPIIGRDGTNLQDQFKDRPKGYLGIAVPNLPNYMVYFGPNSPLAHGSALPAFEHITKYMIRMIHKVQTQGYKWFEPSTEATQDFVDHADAFFPRTVWADKCRSWFKGGKIDGPVIALHPGSRVHWIYMMKEPRYEDYQWKRVDSKTFSYLGNGYSFREVEKRDLAWLMDDPDAGYESVYY